MAKAFVLDPRVQYLVRFDLARRLIQEVCPVIVTVEEEDEICVEVVDEVCIVATVQVEEEEVCSIVSCE